MVVYRTRAELAASSVGGCVLVPTMGALHEGHAALIRRGDELAQREGERCVVSIFVNPTQFDDAADFTRYPRVLDADLDVCERAGASAVFAPLVSEMYPPGEDVPVPPLPAQATEPGLEDALRPGHFRGVCQVVRRLFELLHPATAIFGEKDWQQLQVIRAMTAAEGLDVEIDSVATVREADGLALSSRNVFLTADERVRASALHRALREAQSVCASDPPPQTPLSQASSLRASSLHLAERQAIAERAMRRVLDDAGLDVEYATIRDAVRLVRVPEEAPAPRRALIACRLGSVRLIDNAAWA